MLEARRAAARGDRLTEACLGVAYAKLSRDEEARSIIEALARRREDGYLSAFPLAMVHMALGDTDEAIEWLEQMYRDRDPMGIFLAVGQTVQLARDEGFFGDPRWVGLRRRIEEDGKE